MWALKPLEIWFFVFNNCLIKRYWSKWYIGRTVHWWKMAVCNCVLFFFDTYRTSARHHHLIAEKHHQARPPVHLDQAHQEVHHQRLFLMHRWRLRTSIELKRLWKLDCIFCSKLDLIHFLLVETPQTINFALWLDPRYKNSVTHQ